MASAEDAFAPPHTSETNRETASNAIITEADGDFNTQSDQNSQREAKPITEDGKEDASASVLRGGTITKDYPAAFIPKNVSEAKMRSSTELDNLVDAGAFLAA